MSEKRTEYSFRPDTDEMNTIWANRTDQDELIENLTDWYKRDVMVGSLRLKDISGISNKSRAAVLFAQIGEVAHLELSVENGLLEINRPQSREELVEHAKYVLSGQIAKEAYTEYLKGQSGQ